MLIYLNFKNNKLNFLLIRKISFIFFIEFVNIKYVFLFYIYL